MKGSPILTGQEKLINRYKEANKTAKLKESPVANTIGILNKGMLMLGIKGEKLPSEVEIKMMVKALMLDYGNLPIGELDLAFELGVSGKLDFEVETFQNFSVLYLHRLLSAYSRYATNTIKYIKPEQIDTLLEHSKEIREVSEEEIIQMSYDHYKMQQDWEHIFMALKVFKILHKRNIIKTDQESINKILKLVEDVYESRIRFSYTHETKKKYKQMLNDEDHMELQCRRMAVALYFDELMKESK